MATADLHQALDELGLGNDLASLIHVLSDADMFFMLRNGAGLLVWSSEWLSRVAGGEPESGIGRRHRPGAVRYHLDGSEMPLTDRPSERARRDGREAINTTYGLALPGAPTRWLRVAAIPLRQELEGWSVLTIGHDVTSLLEAAGHEPAAAA